MTPDPTAAPGPQPPDPPPECLTRAAFARRHGWNRAHVTRLAAAGKLVLEGEGRGTRVRVAETEALMRLTAGPRDDVAQRHAETRAAAAKSAAGATNGAADSPEPQPPPQIAPAAPDLFTRAPADPPAGAEVDAAAAADSLALASARHAKLLADSRRIQAIADREEMERDRIAGDLIGREQVELAMKMLGATVRGLLDVFPDQVAPIVTPQQNLHDVHATLTDQCRDVLVRLGEAIDRQRAALQSAPT